MTIDTRIKHVSFDAWNTLISANPSFTEARTLIIANALNTDYASAKARYTAAKKAADHRAEKDCISEPTLDLYTKLMGGDSVLAAKTMLESYQQFVKHQPQMPQNVIDALWLLRNNGISFSVTSNTNFVSGHVLNAVLQMQSGGFAFGIYSDLEGIAKPSASLFGMMYEQARKYNPNIRHRIDVMHVGDNMHCDVWGASSSGFEAHLTTVKELNPITLRKALEQHE